MLHLGDVVRAIDAKPETSQSESTIKRITEMNGLYYYHVSGYTKAFTEDKLELIRSRQLYQRYSIGDVFITGKHKDECDHFGITDDMVPGTTDAMEIRINSVLLRYDGSIMYAYYVNTPKGTLDGIIKPSDTLKHQYTLF